MDAARQSDLANRPKPAARARAGRVPNLGVIFGAKPNKRTVSLSIVLAGDEPPNEFRIFTAGKVETSKGIFVFDDAAAQAVMADYATQGNELMVDYDHASLAGISLDPAQAGKAAGWFNIELRAGELWAVNVRWTEPAAQALRRKEWRYMSPAFSTGDGGQIIGLLNVALTNIPATRKLDPLMAASITALGAQGMDPKLIADALDALVAGDAEKCMEILKGLIASAAGAEVTEPPGMEAPPPAAMDGAPPPPAKEDKPAEMAAALSQIARLSGKSSLVDALAEIKVWYASHLELETERQKLAKERETLESAERRKIYGEFVSLAGRKPATVWEQFDATGKPQSGVAKAYLNAMPIADLRAMHADEVKAHGSRPAMKPPVGKVVKSTADTEPVDALGLTAKEHEICKAAGCTPADFAALKARTT